MARGQIGNGLGLTARGRAPSALAVTTGYAAPQIFGVALNDLKKIQLADTIDVISPAGVVRITGRNVDAMYSSSLLQFSGADAPSIANGDLVYRTGEVIGSGDIGYSGGQTASRGFSLENTSDITRMRARLTAIHASYTPARLDDLTVNDMIYAIRLNDAQSSI